MRFLAGLICAAAIATAQAPDGEKLFKQQCAACHNGAENNRAPAPEVMKQRSPQAIMDSFLGVMRVQGAKLSGPERRAIAEYVTGKTISGDPTGAAFGRCSASPSFTMSASDPLWNGWGPDVANTHSITAKQAGLTAEQVPKLKLKWAFGFPDATITWAQPSLAGGRVFVGSHNGSVYSLDAKTGCIHWVFSAKGGVRTAMSIGAREGGGHAVYFGDTNANAYALDASTGKQLWIRKLDEHVLARVTGSPVLHQGRLYVPLASYEEAQGANPDYECCTFRGSVSALDVKTGAVLWKTYVIPTEPKPRGKSSKGQTLWGPAGSAIWSAVTVDAKRGVVYAATGNTYSGEAQPSSDAVIAFEMETGKIRWMNSVTPKDVFLSGCRGGSTNPNCPEANGPDYDFGNAPILTKLPDGRDAIVIGNKSGVGYAMDVEKKGEIIWQYRGGEGGALGGIEWGSAVDAENAYFPVSDISRPKPGGLHAVKLATGERVWYAPPPPLKCAPGRGCNAAQSAAITVIPGAVFSGSVDGGLRAYSTKDGSIIWEFDTNRDFETVNKVPGKGASMLGPGPVIGGGMMFVNSGYGAFGGRPGNVLLAFGVE